ncbi:MAG: Histidinol-phosphate aminotransferase [Fibrobacteres bacterium]|nr:Histidinol-phosphate aminotransferase [Fibrobacterota bacterium]
MPTSRKKQKSAAKKKPLKGSPKGAPDWDDASILKIARKSIQALKPYIPGKSIEEVRSKYNPSVITKLGSNENPLGASPKVLEALRAALPRVSLYPDGASRDLRAALAEAHGLSPDQVLVGNGSDEVLLLIAAAFLNPGETVLVSENTFSEYEFAGRVMDGKIVKVPLKKNRYHLAGFKKKLALKPKLLFLCNPNNPTGSYFTHAELLDLLQAVPRRTLVVVDEAYCEYADAADFPRSRELLDAFPNLIISRTFSKIFGMAGLRLGYCFAHALLIRETARVKTPFNVNLLVQAAALAALGDKGFRARSIANNLEGRTFLESELEKRGLEYVPTQANFICFRTSRPAVDLCEDLLKQGMIIRALRSFGLDYWNRVTIGKPEQNVRFLEALDSALTAR